VVAPAPKTVVQSIYYFINCVMLLYYVQGMACEIVLHSLLQLGNQSHEGDPESTHVTFVGILAFDLIPP
jgi:hypothetical protein